MNKTFVTVAAAAAILAAAPVFAHHGGGHPCRDRYADYGEARGRWCLGSDWCRAQPAGHEHTDRCYFYDCPGYPMRDVPRGDMQDAPRKPHKVPKDVSKSFGKDAGRVTCGTVSSVDKDASTITIIDADGQNVAVHISSFTSLFIPPKAPSASSASGGTANAGNRVIGPAPRPTAADIPAGSEVMVKAFDTGTKTIEARKVIVIPAS